MAKFHFLFFSKLPENGVWVNLRVLECLQFLLSPVFYLTLTRGRICRAKSGSRNNNPSHMTENYLKVARSTFHEGDRSFFSIFPFESQRYLRPIRHVWILQSKWSSVRRFVRMNQTIPHLTFYSNHLKLTLTLHSVTYMIERIFFIPFNLNLKDVHNSRFYVTWGSQDKTKLGAVLSKWFIVLCFVE